MALTPELSRAGCMKLPYGSTKFPRESWTGPPLGDHASGSGAYVLLVKGKAGGV